MEGEGTSLDLRVGEERSLILPGLATAGYEWSYELHGAREAISLKKQWASGGTDGDLPGTAPVGSAKDEVFTVGGLSPGTATIVFNQRRRWEKGVPPLHTRVVTVRVQQ